MQGRPDIGIPFDGECDTELHRLMLETALDGIIAHTLDGELLYANRAAQEQWGIRRESTRPLAPWDWVPVSQRDALKGIIAELQECGSARFETEPGHGEDDLPRAEVNARVVNGSGRQIVVATIRDVSERLETEQMVRYLAYHDDLTGLANRVRLQQDLFHAISIANRHADVLGVAFIDLDNFKPINDTYGHATGDEVLREVADRISGCVREGDTVARVGGDEFVVVLPRLTSPEALDVVAHKLRNEISRPIHVGGVALKVTASVGTAVHERGEDAESLLNRADLGMYQARGIVTPSRRRPA